MNETSAASRHWTHIGLAIALLGMPLVTGIFNYLEIPYVASNVLMREAVLFALAAVLLVVVRKKERLGWNSVGLQQPRLGDTCLWTLITLVGAAAAIALSLGIAKLAGWRLGGTDPSPLETLPAWVLMLVIMRAGFVEELFARGYAIERLQALTGSRVIAIGLPLVLFAGFHYRQGWAGITIALMAGAVLTAVYVYKRNLWITISAHFLGDFIPNIIVPLF